MRVALRTQQIIAHESGVADTVDPLAGSYVVEYLTDEIEKNANDYLVKIDSMGGALAAIEAGYMQNEIQEAAYQYQRALENKEQTLVGVNAFQVEEKLDMERLKVDPIIEQNQCARLAELRKNRDTAKVSELLGQLEKAAKGKDSLMPLFIECVSNDITLGEITEVLRQVWGEYHTPAWG